VVKNLICRKSDIEVDFAILLDLCSTAEFVYPIYDDIPVLPVEAANLQL
jgi:hypothetical protein